MCDCRCSSVSLLLVENELLSVAHLLTRLLDLGESVVADPALSLYSLPLCTVLLGGHIKFVVLVGCL